MKQTTDWRPIGYIPIIVHAGGFGDGGTTIITAAA